MCQVAASSRDPLQDLPPLLIGSLLQSLQASLHGSGIMGLEDLRHLFFAAFASSVSVSLNGVFKQRGTVYCCTIFLKLRYFLFDLYPFEGYMYFT